jgi:hypothetical protein
MTKLLIPLALLAGVIASAGANAAAPNGATGECKDGTYTSAETKRGACSGHGGVKEWSGKEKPARKEKSSSKSDARSEASQPPKKSETAAAAPKDASGKCEDGSYTSAQTRQGACSAHGGVKDWYAREERSGSKSAAAGGSANRVWVNSSSHVYHCSGDRWYGKTEKGEYMSESQAKSSGNRPDHGKDCSER